MGNFTPQAPFPLSPALFYSLDVQRNEYVVALGQKFFQAFFLIVEFQNGF
jgi:hypothetical protein